MKISIAICFFISSAWSCSFADKPADFSYVKVITSQPADSLTRYNKGWTVGTFLYYEPKKDSLFFFHSGEEKSGLGKTYIGPLPTQSDANSFHTLLHLLRRYGNGDLPTYDSGSFYHGPYYMVEYQDLTGVHYNGFIISIDTLSQFEEFYSRLMNLTLQQGKNGRLPMNGDSELVRLSTSVGAYQRLETPYIPLPCTSQINFQNLYGEWRSTGDLPDNNERNYNKMVFQRDGVWIWQRIRKGVVTKEQRARFTVDIKTKTFTLVDEQFNKLIHYVTNLSKTCLQFKTKTDGISERYDRM